MKKRILFPLALVFILGFAFPVFATMFSDDYRITSSVISGGGKTTTSENFQNAATMGQSSAVGGSSSDNYVNYAGFWYAVIEAILKGDINGDGVIDLADAILAFRTTVGIDVYSIFRSADVNRDGKISIAEVVYVLQNVSGVRQ